MTIIKKLLFTLMFTLVAFPVYAFELLMFSDPDCIYCQKFLAEVEPDYHSTIYAEKLPLRILDTTAEAPEWFKKAYDEERIDGITGTPTFIIWDGERELARLKGYTGKSNFLADIHNFLASNEDKFGVLVYPDLTDRGPMDDFGNAKLPPPGVINSRDLFKHMYKTPKEAVKASDWFGCKGTIHYHKDENVWMPCSMN